MQRQFSLLQTPQVEGGGGGDSFDKKNLDVLEFPWLRKSNRRLTREDK